jgi:hypothetical protein
MSKKKFMLTASIAAVLALVLVAGGAAAYNLSRIPHLFRLNKQLQEEGYYMAEFEFKMLGLAYLLDRGRYVEAIRGVGRLYRQMKTRTGLVKVPRFGGKAEEIEFYLGLQNPETGAFMDPSYPYCTYNEPTENILAHLESLSRESGQPVKLRYPLKYLDRIRDPKDLTAFLDDVGRVGPIAVRFPHTSFFFARSLLSNVSREGILRKNGFYEFSPEWDRAMLKWFAEFQDPETGFWGPRDRRSGKLVVRDLTNTASVLKAFADEDGNDLHPEFPLKYRTELFRTTLSLLAEPMPEPDDYDLIHEWNLHMGKGIKLLLRYLWRDGTADQKAAARSLVEAFLKTKIDTCYVPADGAFSYYPAAERATLDGTGGVLNLYDAVGAFSREVQARLWGGPGTAEPKPAVRRARAIGAGDLADLLADRRVNSVRVLAPDSSGAREAFERALLVFYPGDGRYPDVVDLVPRIRAWLESTSQGMGNWTSKESMLDELPGIPAGIPVSAETFPYAEANGLLRRFGRLELVGLDVLQIPVRTLEFALAP